MSVFVEETRDPACDAISIDSPVGRALLGACEGESRPVLVADQVLIIRVLRIY